MRPDQLIPAALVEARLAEAYRRGLADGHSQAVAVLGAARQPAALVLDEATTAALCRLIEDRTGLVKKQITNKDGHHQTVYVSAHDEPAGGGTGSGGGSDTPPAGGGGDRTSIVHRAVDKIKAIGSAVMATRAAKILTAVEHKLSIVAHKVRDVAAEAGRRKIPPMTEDGIKRLTRVLAIADFIGGSVAGGIIASTVSPVAGKITSTSLPTVSVLYLAYSAATNAAGTWAAARQVARDTLSGKGHAHESELPPLADRLAQLLGGEDGDWREALFLAALAETGDADRAVEVATAAGPMPEQLPQATVDDFGGEPAEGE